MSKFFKTALKLQTLINASEKAEKYSKDLNSIGDFLIKDRGRAEGLYYKVKALNKLDQSTRIGIGVSDRTIGKYIDTLADHIAKTDPTVKDRKPFIKQFIKDFQHQAFFGNRK